MNTTTTIFSRLTLLRYIQTIRQIAAVSKIGAFSLQIGQPSHLYTITSQWAYCALIGAFQAHPHQSTAKDHYLYITIITYNCNKVSNREKQTLLSLVTLPYLSHWMRAVGIHLLLCCSQSIQNSSLFTYSTFVICQMSIIKHQLQTIKILAYKLTTQPDNPTYSSNDQMNAILK